MLLIKIKLYYLIRKGEKDQKSISSLFSSINGSRGTLVLAKVIFKDE